MELEAWLSAVPHGLFLLGPGSRPVPIQNWLLECLLRIAKGYMLVVAGRGVDAGAGRAHEGAARAVCAAPAEERGRQPAGAQAAAGVIQSSLTAYPKGFERLPVDAVHVAGRHQSRVFGWRVVEQSLHVLQWHNL